MIMVCQVLSDSHITRGRASHLELRDNQWIILQQLVVELEPLKVATDFMEGNSYVAIAGVMSLIKGLIAKFTDVQSMQQESDLLPCIVNFRQKMMQSLQKRFKLVVPGDPGDSATSNCLISVYDKAT